MSGPLFTLEVCGSKAEGAGSARVLGGEVTAVA